MPSTRLARASLAVRMTPAPASAVSDAVGDLVTPRLPTSRKASALYAHRLTKRCVSQAHRRRCRTFFGPIKVSSLRVMILPRGDRCSRFVVKLCRTQVEDAFRLNRHFRSKYVKWNASDEEYLDWNYFEERGSDVQ